MNVSAGPSSESIAEPFVASSQLRVVRQRSLAFPGLQLRCSSLCLRRHVAFPCVPFSSYGLF